MRNVIVLFATAAALWLTSCAEPRCGDGYCDGNESASRCPQDCPGYCGDWVCNQFAGESQEQCPWDCEPDQQPTERCGNGHCDSGETRGSCPIDCDYPQCGDGTCDWSEDAYNCPDDCGVCPPEFPVLCDDGTCWTLGTNCDSTVFTCGGILRHCASEFSFVSCCQGLPVECSSAGPYFCPEDGVCYGAWAVPWYCTPSCEIMNVPCN